MTTEAAAGAIFGLGTDLGQLPEQLDAGVDDLFRQRDAALLLGHRRRLEAAVRPAQRM